MCSIIGYCGRGYSLPAFTKSFNETISRGPDDTRVIDTGKGLLGFHRLAIMGLEDSGMQPFTLSIRPILLFYFRNNYLFAFPSPPTGFRVGQAVFLLYRERRL